MVIVTLATENVLSYATAFINTWACFDSVDHIYVYTDCDAASWHPKVSLINHFSKCDDWFTNIGRKVPALLHFVSTHEYKDVLFLDADCYIANDVQCVFDEDKLFIFAVTSLSNRMNALNGGVYFVRKCDEIIDVLNQIVQQQQLCIYMGMGIEPGYFMYDEHAVRIVWDAHKKVSSDKYKFLINYNMRVDSNFDTTWALFGYPIFHFLGDNKAERLADFIANSHKFANPDNWEELKLDRGESLFNVFDIWWEPLAKLNGKLFNNELPDPNFILPGTKFYLPIGFREWIQAYTKPQRRNVQNAISLIEKHKNYFDIKPAESNTQWSIVTYCSHHYRPIFETMLKQSLMYKTIQDIYVYTDDPEWFSDNEQVKIIYFFEESDSWIEHVGRKAICLHHFVHNFDCDNVALLDADVLLLKDVGHVFDNEFIAGACASFNHAAGCFEDHLIKNEDILINSGAVYIKNSDSARKLVSQWVDKQNLLKANGVGQVPYTSAYDQMALSLLLEETPDLKLLPFRYNFEYADKYHIPYLTCILKDVSVLHAICEKGKNKFNFIVNAIMLQGQAATLQIKEGDTLYKLFGEEWPGILLLNEGLNPNTLEVGQTINVTCANNYWPDMKIPDSIIGTFTPLLNTLLKYDPPAEEDIAVELGSGNVSTPLLANHFRTVLSYEPNAEWRLDIPNVRYIDLDDINKLSGYLLFEDLRDKDLYEDFNVDFKYILLHDAELHLPINTDNYMIWDSSYYPTSILICKQAIDKERFDSILDEEVEKYRLSNESLYHGKKTVYGLNSLNDSDLWDRMIEILRLRNIGE